MVKSKEFYPASKQHTKLALLLYLEVWIWKLPYTYTFIYMIILFIYQIWRLPISFTEWLFNTGMPKNVSFELKSCLLQVCIW